MVLVLRFLLGFVCVYDVSYCIWLYVVKFLFFIREMIMLRAYWITWSLFLDTLTAFWSLIATSGLEAFR